MRIYSWLFHEETVKITYTKKVKLYDHINIQEADMDHDKLAAKIKGLVAEIDKYAGDKRWNVLLETIYKQGWTTPAEYRLVSGIVENMTEQLRVTIKLQDTLFEGSNLVLDKRAANQKLQQ